MSKQRFNLIKLLLPYSFPEMPAWIHGGEP